MRTIIIPMYRERDLHSSTTLVRICFFRGQIEQISLSIPGFSAYWLTLAEPPYRPLPSTVPMREWRCFLSVQASPHFYPRVRVYLNLVPFGFDTTSDPPPGLLYTCSALPGRHTFNNIGPLLRPALRRLRSNYTGPRSPARAPSDPASDRRLTLARGTRHHDPSFTPLVHLRQQPQLFCFILYLADLFPQE